jgi:hypothetical protein
MEVLSDPSAWCLVFSDLIEGAGVVAKPICMTTDAPVLCLDLVDRHLSHLSRLDWSSTSSVSLPIPTRAVTSQEAKAATHNTPCPRASAVSGRTLTVAFAKFRIPLHCSSTVWCRNGVWSTPVGSSELMRLVARTGDARSRVLAARPVSTVTDVVELVAA